MMPARRASAFACVALLTGLVGHSGCAGPSNGVVIGGRTGGIIAGINYELPWQVGPSELVEDPQKGSLLVNHGKTKFVIENGKIWLNGKDFGQIAAGDHVQLTEDENNVFVNGSKRLPEPINE